MKYTIKAGKGPFDPRRTVTGMIEAETWSLRIANDLIDALRSGGYDMLQILETSTSSVIYEEIRDSLSVDKRHKWAVREAGEQAHIPAPEMNT